jgi:hypothetical protein
MHQSEYESSLGGQAPVVGLGLWYDAERLLLEGIYLDEVSAYRARRSWIKAFEMNFLLEDIHDFRVKVSFDVEESHYRVQCSFTSACGRYAFWRLTHHQAPEVQFALETAHLPHVATMRFVDSIIDADEEALSQVFCAAPEEKPESEVFKEMLDLVKRKTRKYYRKARSLCSRMFHR